MTTPDATVARDHAANVEALMALLHPVFRDCLDTEVKFYDLSSPFPFGEGAQCYICAVDAYIGARCPATAPIIDASELVEVGVTAKRPKLTGIFRPAADFAPLPISIPEPPVLRPCPQCTKGVLPAGRTCPTCRGTRHDKCNMGYDHDCEECDGKGTLGEAEACYKCWGTGFDGVRLMASAVKVGPALLGWRFATLLRKHGAVAFAHSNGSAREPLRWIIPGTNVDGTVYVMHEV